MSNVKSQTYGYYPGCSAHATAQEYDASVKAVFEALGMRLVEIEDWNCCGASSAHNMSANLAVGLPARNLALIEKSGLPALAPCAACYNRLRVAQMEIGEHPERFTWLEQALGAPLEGSAVVRSPLGILFQDIGLERIAALVKKPLTGIRAVSYYGCLLARPASISELGDTEHPREIDELMSLLGAEMLPWSYAVDCCGGSLSISRSDVARRLTQTIVDAAIAAGANVIITACPLCQTNLEMRQTPRDGRKIPALYFTEAMGVAFDLPGAERWWSKHLVDPRPVIKRDT
jgi:heterodisulfide reductase subunit B